MQNTNVEPHEQILSLILGFWQAHAVGLINRLSVVDILAYSPVHVDELARRTETNAPALFRLLRGLESVTET